MNIEQQLNGNQSRRMAAQDRFLGRIEKREDDAEQMIGELSRNGETVYYINIRNPKGTLTGKTKEGKRNELISYLVRNNYV